jgi:uncharacterized protein YpmB
MYNRKNRRETEKQLGFIQDYQNMTEAEKAEVRQRRREAGRQIHLQNSQNVENARITAEADKEAKLIQSFMDSGMDEAEAKRIVENNRMLTEKRALKLHAKKSK